MEQLSLKGGIELAITTEKLGAKYYSDLADKFADSEQVHQIFDRLSKDEQIHEAQFKVLLDELPSKEEKSAVEDQEFLKSLSSSKFFDTSAFNVDDIENAADALEMAAEFEKNSLVYYQALKEIIGESPQLDEIIKAEKKHFVTITKVLITEAKFRGTEDRW